MKIAPVQRCASLAERHTLSLNIFPDAGLITPGDASLARAHAVTSLRPPYLSPASLARD